MLANISKSQKVAVMIGVMLAMLLSALDQTIVATAMPRIVRDLNGLEHLSWVITSYLLASTVIVPIYGKLSDIYGRKYFILAAVFIFLLGSVFSGLSQNMGELIAARFIQGLGGGAIFANAFAIIGDLFTPRERGRWQGMFGAVFGLASVIGPALGGWITDNASWRWNFFINLPVGLLALIVIGLLMPYIRSDIKDRSIDYAGAIFLSGGLITLLLGLVWGGSQFAWDSWQIFVLLGAAIWFLVMFFFIEERVREPILPLELFKNPIFNVSIITIFLTGLGMFGAILYIPLFAQLVLGASATDSGGILTPMMLSMVVASVLTGQVISRTGHYKWIAVVGLGIGTLGMYLLSGMGVSTSQGNLILRMILLGVGLGVSFPIFTLAVQNAFDHSKMGVVTASTQLFRSIGGTVGTAVLGGVLNSSLSSKLGQLSRDPFIGVVSQINPNIKLDQLDINTLQTFLTGPSRAALESMLPQDKMPLFHTFLGKIQLLFAQSLTEVFGFGAAFMALAFIATFFLKEIPLRKTHAQGVEEVGLELAEEEGNFPAASEPLIY